MSVAPDLATSLLALIVIPSDDAIVSKDDLPPVRIAAEVSNGMAAVVVALAVGEVTPEEAATISNVLEARRKAHQRVPIRLFEISLLNHRVPED